MGEVCQSKGCGPRACGYVFQWSYAETEEFFVGLIEDGLMRPPLYDFGPTRVFRPPAIVCG